MRPEPWATAVLQVFCIHSEPNFSLPWQRKRQFSSTSSGFIIPGNRILTNAHCVDHHTQVLGCVADAPAVRMLQVKISAASRIAG